MARGAGEEEAGVQPCKYIPATLPFSSPARDAGICGSPRAVVAVSLCNETLGAIHPFPLPFRLGLLQYKRRRPEMKGE